MIIVLDVSAAMQIILKKEKKELFENIYRKSSWVIAPEIYIPEITNAFWKYYNSGILIHEECQNYVQDGVELIDDFFQESELWKEVLGESIKNKHSSYDMFYAVLARRNDAVLVSNDNELVKVCKGMKIETFS